MIKLFSCLGIFFLVSISLGAQNAQDEFPNHSLWTNELQKFVSSDGVVDYKSWKEDSRSLEEYLIELQTKGPKEWWGDEHRMAFWINTYNAFTAKLILDNYPVKSITDIRNGKPWDWRWIQIGNLKFSLNQIENDILRPEFKDPRIHFALNCAAISCPPLQNQAFVPESLTKQLEQRTTAFVKDKMNNKITPDRLVLSRIFEWYAKDFEDLIAFIQRYSGIEIDLNAEIDYLEYDWSLNGY